MINITFNNPRAYAIFMSFSRFMKACEKSRVRIELLLDDFFFVENLPGFKSNTLFTYTFW